MDDRHITTDLADGILTITLNRPERLNAFTGTMSRELGQAFCRADEDDAVRVVLVTGAGRGFCAGADISGGADAFADGAVFNAAERESGAARSFILDIHECRKPSIAAINGPAVGVGITMALPMDIRIASTEARFGFVFARRGLVPEAGSAWFLPRLVGLPQALRWCLSGGVFGAEEALRGGLVSEVVAPEALLPAARAIAREIADNTAPVALALTRQMLWRFGSAPDPRELLGIDYALSRELGAGPDVKEGVAAFLGKRRPEFPGRVSRDMPAAWRRPG
ncbi:enoyl-CoA hydratase-related protein [Roseicella aquatilis]|uniref:Enoyl-CoA hydratase n=1 Tax=Roseicella aquatilis TaxID=2527868 RepID=A0A4R4DUL5_9PROT|nr:enoyl-CoA hydratase-related protein [Roseicella aquatilis]TCZ64804.1 enoyl-CoA hydratase [Roseicella aquatilis]